MVTFMQPIWFFMESLVNIMYTCVPMEKIRHKAGMIHIMLPKLL